MNSGPNNDNDVGKNDGAFASNLLAENECYDSTERAPDVVDGGDEPSHCGRGVAQGVFEALAAQDTAEETLVIYIVLNCERKVDDGKKRKRTYIQKAGNQDPKSVI